MVYDLGINRTQMRVYITLIIDARNMIHCDRCLSFII